MINHVAAASSSAGTTGRSHADGAEAIHQNARTMSFVVDLDPALDQLFVEMQHARSDGCGSAGRAKIQNLREPHRQLHLRTPILYRLRSCGEDVQRAIK